LQLRTRRSINPTAVPHARSAALSTHEFPLMLFEERNVKAAHRSTFSVYFRDQRGIASPRVRALALQAWAVTRCIARDVGSEMKTVRLL